MTDETGPKPTNLTQADTKPARVFTPSDLYERYLPPDINNLRKWDHTHGIIKRQYPLLPPRVAADRYEHRRYDFNRNPMELAEIQLMFFYPHEGELERNQIILVPPQKDDRYRLLERRYHIFLAEQKGYIPNLLSPIQRAVLSVDYRTAKFIPKILFNSDEYVSTFHMDISTDASHVTIDYTDQRTSVITSVTATMDKESLLFSIPGREPVMFP